LGGKQPRTQREFEVLDANTELEIAEKEETILADGTNWLPINMINVGTRFRKDLGDLRELKESINEVGLLQPIVVDEENRLVAGFRRLEACKQLNWVNIPIHRVQLKDLLKGEFHENAVRKDFTISEVVAIKRVLKPELQKEHPWGGMRENKVQILHLESSGSKVRDVIGKFVGLSGWQVEKAEKIVKAAEDNPEQFGKLLQSIDAGKTSIDYGYQQIKKAEKHNNPPPLPAGEFDVIYADPPWKYEYSAIDGNAEVQYETLSIEELSKLKVPSATNSILFLWATNPLLREALQVMKAWGFEYKTNMVWVKNGLGVGHFFRGDHELLLVGKRGDIPPPMTPRSSVLNATKNGHSRKPTEAYSIIETMYPNRKYLELFARGEARLGWTIWGKEASAQN
jgi:ParB/RepB/Spo0J family partition protein